MYRLMIDGFTLCCSDDKDLLIERAENIRPAIGKAMSIDVWSEGEANSATMGYVYSKFGLYE
jgi:hypothetical protein